jgi:hypothetical protein
MVVGSSPDPRVCSLPSPERVDVLHRVWLGQACPEPSEVVSFIAAALLLRPTRIYYFVDKANPFSCRGPGCQCLWTCQQALGAEFKFVNRLDAVKNQFGRAVADFKAHEIVHKPFWSQQIAQHLSDFVRLWAIQQSGGVYVRPQRLTPLPQPANAPSSFRDRPATQCLSGPHAYSLPCS